WFLMWQSKIWNGQEEAFRMFTIVGVVFLVVVQREPTPDWLATLLCGDYFPLARDTGVSGGNREQTERFQVFRRMGICERPVFPRPENCRPTLARWRGKRSRVKVNTVWA